MYWSQQHIHKQMHTHTHTHTCMCIYVDTQSGTHSWEQQQFTPVPTQTHTPLLREWSLGTRGRAHLTELLFATHVCMYGRGGLSYVATHTTLWSGRELWLSDHTVHNIPAGGGVWVGPRSLHGMLNCRHGALCWRGIYAKLHSTHTILLSKYCQC